MWVNAYLSIKTLKLPESTQLLQMASFVQMALLHYIGKFGLQKLSPPLPGKILDPHL